MQLPQIWQRSVSNGKYKPYHKTSYRTGVERCTCADENASDDRTAGSRCQSGRFYPDLYLQYRNVFCSAMDINELVREYQNEMTE